LTQFVNASIVLIPHLSRISYVFYHNQSSYLCPRSFTRSRTSRSVSYTLAVRSLVASFVLLNPHRLFDRLCDELLHFSSRLHRALDRSRVMTASHTSEMIATKEEMKAARLDIGYRDFCAHLLIPLNECRRKSFYLPWKCEHERHVYEKCQYKECVLFARAHLFRSMRARTARRATSEDGGARTRARTRSRRSTRDEEQK